MSKKLKLPLTIFFAAVCLAILVIVVKAFIDSPYRTKLPSKPDPKTVSIPVQEQIESANKRAYFYPSAKNLGSLGMVYYSCGFNESATRCYQLAVERDPKQWVWSYYQGYLKHEMGDSKASIENFQRVIVANPRNYLAMFYMGEAYQALGKTDSAEKIFEKIVSANDIDENYGTGRNFPLKTYAMFQLARIYMDSNRVDSAGVVFKDIITSQETFRPAYRFLSNVYKIKGDLALAEKYSIMANDLSEFSIPPRDRLIDSIAMISRSDVYLLKQIDNAVRCANYPLALTLSEHALEYFPENKFLVSKAVCEYFRKGLDSKGLLYLDRHFNGYSDEFNELRDFATILYGKGLYNESMKYFNRLKQLKPDNSSLAIWLFERGKKDEAMALLNEQLKNYPENEAVLSDMIYLLMRMGNNTLAKEYLTTFKRLAPNSPKVLIITGMMAEKNGDQNQAISYYEQAVKLDPKDFSPVDYLITLYMQQKKWKKAIVHCKHALGSFPNNPVLLEKIGKLLVACPDPKFINVSEGVEYSKRAFINIKSQYETRLSAGSTLALAYASLGDKPMATKYMNLTLQLARERKLEQEYIQYFNSIKQLYKIF